MNNTVFDQIRVNRRFNSLPIILVFCLSVCSIQFAHSADRAFSSLEKTLRRALVAKPDYYSVQRIRNGDFASDILHDLFEGLLIHSARGQIAPGMAESWAVSDDGLLYTFTLRSNLYWSDGAPIHSRDFTLGMKRSSKLNRKNADSSSNGTLVDNKIFIENQWVTVSELSRNKLSIRLSKPYPDLLNYLAKGVFPVPSHLYEKHGDDWDQIRPLVSNGSYRMENEFENKAILSLNPFFYDKDNINYHQIIYSEMEQGCLLGFADGELDITPVEISQGHVNWIDQYTKKSFVLDDQGMFSFFSVNTEFDHLIKPEVQAALSLAVDRDALSALFGGDSIALNKLTDHYSDGFSHYNKSLQKAKSLMTLADVSEKQPLEINLSYWSNEVNSQVSQALKVMWRQINVDLKLKPLSYKSMKSDLQSANYEILLNLKTYALSNADQKILTETQRKITTEMSHEQRDLAGIDIQSILTAKENAGAEKIKLKINQNLKQKFVFVPLVYSKRAWLVSPDVIGFYPNSDGLHLSRWISPKFKKSEYLASN